MKEKRKEGLINGEDLKRGQLEVHVISSQTFFSSVFFPSSASAAAASLLAN